MSTEQLRHGEERFAGAGYDYGTAPNRFRATSRGLLPASGRAIADGEGRNGVFLAECGLDVLSVDVSSTAQGKARASAADRGVPIATETVDLIGWQ